MQKILLLLLESFRFAWNALVNNKLRTLLSLLGITIGIFAIVAVYAIVDSLEYNIRKSVSSLGTDVVYVQKWPWGREEGEFAWWKYFQRPEVSVNDFKRLTSRRLNLASEIAYVAGSSEVVKQGNSSVENVQVNGVSMDYGTLNGLTLSSGRYFTELEMASGKNVAVLGSEIAEALFPSGLGSRPTIQTLGREFLVIGVLPLEGSSITGNSHDTKILIPYPLFSGLKGEEMGGSAIQVKAKPSASMEALKNELRFHMRAIRRLKPVAEDDFSLNETAVFSQGLDDMFGVIGLAGTIIGGFSILVGGFGIANIMFVTVRERTGQIGIQKALGATRSFILLQFLMESTVLSVIGGAAGLLLVGVALYLGTQLSGFELFLSYENALLGLTLSAVIGVISGLAPAYSAAKLNPVDAIRHNQ